MVPKHEAPYREFNVAAAVRDVSCVTCRACDVARDRSIGRESLGRRIVVLSVRRFCHLIYLAKPSMRRSDNYVSLSKYFGARNFVPRPKSA